MSRWESIGPRVVKLGQGEVKPDTSGRTTGIAISRDGNRVYVATANGGVWRSDDTGKTWYSLMEAFDLNPQHRQSDSLACGAIAIDLDNPDKVYVGTGDGPGTAYFGVGPIYSPNGGQDWITESVKSGDPPLAGSAFYALAVDPSNSENVVGGTLRGVYRREKNGSDFHWVRKNIDGGKEATSVVVAHKGSVTTFFASHYGGRVFSSNDGDVWSVLGTEFPGSNVGQVRLAVQPDNPDVLYALIAHTNGSLLGIWRWDKSDDTWREISGSPSDLFGTTSIGFQGWYDLAIAVDPNDENLIYLGGSTKDTGSDWSGCAYRSTVSKTGTGSSISYSMNNVFIGNSVHADIHNLVFAPNDSNKLWLGCDGGVFYSTNPKNSATGNLFASCNDGLSTLMMEHMGQHPTNSAILFCGTQDNGGLKYASNPDWSYSSGGDAGFQIINWSDPSKILSSYVQSSIRRSTNGGQRYSYSDVSVSLSTGERALFYAPLVGTPYNPSNPSESNIVAFGSERPWISTTFGGNWTSIPNNSFSSDRLNERIRSLVFASSTKLYAGTRSGGVYRFDKSGSSWTRTQIDTMGGTNVLPLKGIITDIAIDPSDSSGNSIYISLGGSGDFRHVWHFDGTEWEQRSGPATDPSKRLLDIHANAIIADTDNPGNIYVGMDIGCWRSTDGGLSWSTFSKGLPDAAIMDLKIHSSGIIRASTHGRGVFKRRIKPTGTGPAKPKLLPIERLKSRYQGGEGALRLNDSRHNLVTDLQEILVYLGYDLGNFGPKNNGVDGFFGNATRNAVIKFQRTNKDNNGKQLGVDAMVGPLTGGALNRRVEES